MVDVTRKATSRLLFSSPDILFGLWNCPPDCKLWSTENNIGPAPVIALPWTAVVIDRASSPRAMMNPNSVVYYSPHEPYKRQLASTRGDQCAFISPSPLLLTTILEEAGLDTTSDAPPFKSGPAVSWATASHHMLAKSIIGNNSPPNLVIESVLMEVARETILAAAQAACRKRKRNNTTTSRTHGDIVTHATELMACAVSDSSAETIRLADLAKQVHTSPFHLCRIFKQQTGESIAQHYLRLRLRAATERLAWSDDTITSIAHDYGFANHAHFTTAWKSEFGYPPSALRKANAGLYNRARN